MEEKEGENQPKTTVSCFLLQWTFRKVLLSQRQKVSTSDHILLQVCGDQKTNQNHTKRGTVVTQSGEWNESIERSALLQFSSRQTTY